MISPDHLIHSYRWSADAFERLVSDVPDELMAEQPVEAINHPAWLLGHVTPYHGVIVALLRGEDFQNPWNTACGRNSSPTSDRSAYPSKHAILQTHREAVKEAIEAIQSAQDPSWSAPFEHEWGKQFDTVAPAVVFLTTTHLALHLGQLSGWRRAMGLARI